MSTSSVIHTAWTHTHTGEHILRAVPTQMHVRRLKSQWSSHGRVSLWLAARQEGQNGDIQQRLASKHTHTHTKLYKSTGVVNVGLLIITHKVTRVWHHNGQSVQHSDWTRATLTGREHHHHHHLHYHHHHLTWTSGSSSVRLLVGAGVGISYKQWKSLSK